MRSRSENGRLTYCDILVILDLAKKLLLDCGCLLFSLFQSVQDDLRIDFRHSLLRETTEVDVFGDVDENNFVARFVNVVVVDWENVYLNLSVKHRTYSQRPLRKLVFRQQQKRLASLIRLLVSYFFQTGTNHGQRVVWDEFTNPC